MNKELNKDDLINELNRMKLAVDFMLMFSPTKDGIKMPEWSVEDDKIELHPDKEDKEETIKKAEQAHKQILQLIEASEPSEAWIEKKAKWLLGTIIKKAVIETDDDEVAVYLHYLGLCKLFIHNLLKEAKEEKNVRKR